MEDTNQMNLETVLFIEIMMFLAIVMLILDWFINDRDIKRFNLKKRNSEFWSDSLIILQKGTRT